jgi:hypothetical protein
MGMDVSGRSPITEEGEYFRANCWSWRPIHALIQIANNEHGGTLVDSETIESMSYNDGAGCEDQEQCEMLADALEDLLKHPEKIEEAGLIYYQRGKEGHISFPVSKECAVTEDGRFVSKEDEIDPEKMHSAYRVYLDHVAEFIEFLRSCGGFSVW